MQALNALAAAEVVAAAVVDAAGGALLGVDVLFDLLPHAANTMAAAQATAAIFIPRDERKTHHPLDRFDDRALATTRLLSGMARAGCCLIRTR
jgi:hypothetical protein